MEPIARNSKPYSPKTEQERNEPFRLLDEFEKELARQVAFREAVVESLAGRAMRRRRQPSKSQVLSSGLEQKDEGFEQD